MPGVNRTGKPTTSDLWLGRGSLHIAPLDATTGKPLGFRHLGNLVALTVSAETETLEHFSSRSGIKVADREILLSQKLNISVTLDETANFENLALYLSGQASKDNTNRAATGGNITDRLITADAFKGLSYELSDSSGARLYDIVPGNLTLKSHATTLGSAVALTLGTDYEIDERWGTIFLLSTGSTHVDGNSLWFSYTSAGTEKTVDIVNMLTTSSITGFLRFKGINPANSDKQMLIDWHSVVLKADGELGLIGEEFAELSLSGVAGKNELGYPTAPVGRIYYHGDA